MWFIYLHSITSWQLIRGTYSAVTRWGSFLFELFWSEMITVIALQCPDFVVLSPFCRLQSSTVATAAAVTPAPGRAATGGAIWPAGDRNQDEIPGLRWTHLRLSDWFVSVSNCGCSRLSEGKSALPGAAAWAPVAVTSAATSSPAHAPTPAGVAVVGVWPAFTDRQQRYYFRNITRRKDLLTRG